MWKKDCILSVQSVTNDPLTDVNVVKYRKTEGWAWQVSRQQLRDIPAEIQPASYQAPEWTLKTEYGWKESKTTHLLSDSSWHIYVHWEMKTQTLMYMSTIQKTVSYMPNI